LIRGKAQRSLFLLADGDAAYSSEFKKALARSGVASKDIVVLHDGQRLLRYLAGSGPYANRTRYPLPEVLLVDVWLPKKSGFDILEWIRKSPRCRSLPVIVLSIGEDRALLDRAYRLGANSFVVKPFRREKLTAIVSFLVHYWRHINMRWKL
jgi:CheY-like chemotaxis protein